MRCPLCGGPVHEEDPGRSVCEVGQAELVRSADQRLAEALWMAIEALHNGADALRVTGMSADGRSHADDADEQARVLRDLARRHAARMA